MYLHILIDLASVLIGFDLSSQSYGTKKWLNGNPDRAGREFWQRRVRGADDPEGAREPEPQGPVAVGLHQDTPGRNQRRAFYVYTDWVVLQFPSRTIRISTSFILYVHEVLSIKKVGQNFFDIIHLIKLLLVNSCDQGNNLLNVSEVLSR